jgi:hypothetical protein
LDFKKPDLLVLPLGSFATGFFLAGTAGLTSRLILNFLAGAGGGESCNEDAGNRGFLRCFGTSGDDDSAIEMRNNGQNAMKDLL